MNNSRIKLLVFFVIATIVSVPCAHADEKRDWKTTTCQFFSLTVRDNQANGSFVARYVVTASNGNIFVATRKATDEDSARVTFPDSFVQENSKQKAWVNCRYNDRYKWEIYANGTLIDSGASILTRNRPN